MVGEEDIKSLLDSYQRADDVKKVKRKIVDLSEKGNIALQILRLLHQQIHQSQAGVYVRVTQSGIIDYALRQQLELMLRKIREEQEKGRGRGEGIP